MQKLDFTEHIDQLCRSLISHEILDIINIFNTEGSTQEGIKLLTSFIIKSKSNFDHIWRSPKQKILLALNGNHIYSDDNIGDIVHHLGVMREREVTSRPGLFNETSMLDFYRFHVSLNDAAFLCKEILFDGGLKRMQDNEDSIIFRILIEGDLKISRYTKILTLITELVVIIQKVNSEEESEPVITLFDSGSDTNLGIKTTVETTRSLFQIFKEIWDWTINRKSYKSKLRNEEFLDNLKVMTAIHEAKEKGVIDEKTAKIFKEQILRKTEDLLKFNVVPRVLVLEERQQDDAKKFLGEHKETKLLESGKGE